jgi:hypothetical protein
MYFDPSNPYVLRLAGAFSPAIANGDVHAKATATLSKNGIMRGILEAQKVLRIADPQ